MLHNQLPAHQDRHAKQGRTQHKLGMAEGFEKLPGQVGDDESRKEMGPTMAVATAMQRVTPSSRRRMQRS